MGWLQHKACNLSQYFMWVPGILSAQVLLFLLFLSPALGSSLVTVACSHQGQLNFLYNLLRTSLTFFAEAEEMGQWLRALAALTEDHLQELTSAHCSSFWFLWAWIHREQACTYRFLQVPCLLNMLNTYSCFIEIGSFFVGFFKIHF